MLMCVFVYTYVICVQGLEFQIISDAEIIFRFYLSIILGLICAFGVNYQIIGLICAA